MCRVLFVGILFAVSLACLPAAADFVVDFSAAESTPGGPQGGNHWNTIGGSGTGDDADLFGAALVDTTGTATAVTMDVDFDFGFTNGWGGTGINGSGASAPLDQSFAMIDGIFSDALNSNPNQFGANLVIHGLNASSTYDVMIHTGRATGSVSGSILPIFGTFSFGSSLITSNNTTSTFSATTNGSGQLGFRFIDAEGGTNPSGSAVLNSMYFSAAIPEPGSIALLGFCAIGLVSTSRRRK